MSRTHKMAVASFSKLGVPVMCSRLIIGRTSPIAYRHSCFIFPLIERRDVHITPARFAASAGAEGKGHGSHWIAERAVAMSLYAVIPAACVLPQSFAMDMALTSTLVLHAHWGIAAVFQDYVHGYPGKTGERRHPILTTVSKVAPLTLSIAAFACLTSFNYNDVGLINAIAMLWRV